MFEEMNLEQANMINEKSKNVFSDKIATEKISRYDYEANKQGCIILDYDKYDRDKKLDTMFIISALMIYFGIGIICGVAIA